MAQVMTAAGPRAMSFTLRRLDDGPRERWQWTVQTGSDVAILRDGEIAGDRDKAERAARAAVAIMGGVVRHPEND